MQKDEAAAGPVSRQVRSTVDPLALRVQLMLPAVADIESVQFLRFVINLSEALNVDIPKSDYWRLTTLEGCAEYLAA